METDTELFVTEQVNNILVSRETSEITTGVKLIDLLRRPQLDYEALKDVDVTRPDIDSNIFEQVEIEVKYAGYIEKQLKQVEQMKKLEKKLLPDNFDYKGLILFSFSCASSLNPTSSL